MTYLGGSTGAMLVTIGDGSRWVLKWGGDPGHAREEFYADRVYRLLGVPVPETRLQGDPFGRSVRASRFVEGRTLRDLLLARDPAAPRVASELRKGFAVDALLANRDVVGVRFENPLLGADGVVYRVDNGAALRFRARGRPKAPGEFAAEVGELSTLRDPRVTYPANCGVFSALSDREVALQVAATVAPNGAAILGVLPRELRETMAARVRYMAAWAAEVLRGRAA